MTEIGYTEYVINNRTTRDIATELECGKKTISTFLKKYKIPTKRSRRGLFKSAAGKCSDFWYDSTWEREVAKRFDHDMMVLKFIKEPFPIFYTNRKQHRYFPDFLVILTDGRMFLIEIKPDGLLPYVQQKIKAGLMSGFIFCVLNDEDNFPW